MGIEWWRDLMIIVVGFLCIFILIGVCVIGLKLYRQTKLLAEKLELVTKKLDKTADTVQGFATFITTELGRPAIEIASLFSGLKQGLSGLFRKKGG